MNTTLITGQLDCIRDAIVDARTRLPHHRALLVAVSGIDASGKGYLTDRLTEKLRQCAIRAEVIHADGWLNLPHKRFSTMDPARHFYEHAFRFDEMFAQLIDPLRERRSVSIEADYAEETARQFRRQRYEFHDVDVIVLEAIFLLKREMQRRYDLSIWIDCTFETALERALLRAQEGLPPQETVRAYESIYFPAQRIHFLQDEPQRAAKHVIVNDARLDCSNAP